MTADQCLIKNFLNFLFLLYWVIDAAKIAEFWLLSVSFTALQKRNRAYPSRQPCCPLPREAFISLHHLRIIALTATNTILKQRSFPWHNLLEFKSFQNVSQFLDGLHIWKRFGGFDSFKKQLNEVQKFVWLCSSWKYGQILLEIYKNTCTQI